MEINVKQRERRRNWLDLPSDVTADILIRIGITDILKNAQRVCTAWYKICKYPSLWTVIDTNHLLTSRPNLSSAPARMFKQAVDRSQGQLVDITIAPGFSSNFVLYIADRASELRRLEMMSDRHTGRVITNALIKFPLLEELNLYSITISKEEIETIGRYCPLIKTLKLNYEREPRNWATGRTTTTNTDEGVFNAIAIAIGQNLPELRHLELIGNSMTNIGLKVILDKCHRLETLDLRACSYIDLKGDLGEKCCKQIKNLKFPEDSIEGCPYSYEILSDLQLEDYLENHPYEYDYDEFWPYGEDEYNDYGPYHEDDDDDGGVYIEG